MTEFHTSGNAPVWREFFNRWNKEVRIGERNVAPFRDREAPNFHAVSIEKQEILQQQ